jgi:hypothetical protein
LAFDATQYATKLRTAAADIRRGFPGSTDAARLAQRLERHAYAILSPEGIHHAEELLAFRALKRIQA